MTNRINQSARPTEQDRLGRLLAARLSQASDALPHDIAERLRVARQQALAGQPQWQPRAAASVLASGGAAVLGAGAGRFGPWRLLGSLLPLLALVAGLIGLNLLVNEQRARELAELDAAILTDDLPPAAYADPGFLQFLKSAPRETGSQ